MASASIGAAAPVNDTLPSVIERAVLIDCDRVSRTGSCLKRTTLAFLYIKGCEITIEGLIHASPLTTVVQPKPHSDESKAQGSKRKRA